MDCKIPLTTLPTASPTLTSEGESAFLQWVVNERHLLVLRLPVLFSVTPVPSCYVCLLHFHLHAQRSCWCIQPYQSKEFTFQKVILEQPNSLVLMFEGDKADTAAAAQQIPIPGEEDAPVGVAIEPELTLGELTHVWTL